MARQDQERQHKLEPKRVEHSKKVIINAGYQIETVTKTTITFFYKDQRVTFYPYSGWCTGKSINDGRGLNHLVEQIKK